MHLDEKSIRRIVDEVWTLVLNASTAACCRDGADGESALVSSVDVSGAWEGGVAVRCSLSLARLIAARTHRLQGAEPTNAQMRFALGEIASLLGAGINGLLSKPARVSRPVVVEAPAGTPPESRGPASTTWLSSLGHPFAVTVSLHARGA